MHTMEHKHTHTHTHSNEKRNMKPNSVFPANTDKTVEMAERERASEIERNRKFIR